MKDKITIAVCFVALLGLMGWAVSEAMGSLFGEPSSREKVVLTFKPGEFVPAGGITDRGKRVAIRVDSRGYVLCSPTVFLEIEKAR